MHESIDNRVIELREIALQIINILDKARERTNTLGMLEYGYNYLKVLASNEMQWHAKNYGVSLHEAYETQILYCISNLRYWKGNDAKHYKAMLKEYLAYFQGKQNTGKLSDRVNPMWQAIMGVGD